MLEVCKCKDVCRLSGKWLMVVDVVKEERMLEAENYGFI